MVPNRATHHTSLLFLWFKNIFSQLLFKNKWNMRFVHISCSTTFDILKTCQDSGQGRAPYLRSRTSSNHNFRYTWYTSVKWWYQAFFSFFWNFHYSGCYGGKRSKNSPKWKMTITSFTHHVSGTVYHIMIFIFFEIFIFRAVREIKGQKIGQNEK